MAYEQVTVTLPDSISENNSKALVSLLFTAIVSAVACFLSVLVSICVLVVGVVVAVRFWGKSKSEVNSTFREDVNGRGIVFDFDLGSMGIDTKSRKAVFFCRNDGYDVLDISDILGWEHKSYPSTQVHRHNPPSALRPE